jgi:hypothetical protein
MFSMACRCLRILRARSTNGFSLDRDAQASQSSSRCPPWGALDLDDLAERLLQLVRPVEGLVRRRDPGELDLLGLGQVDRVLPQRVPGTLELAGGGGVLGAAGVVPDLAADLVQCVGGPGDEVERIIPTSG